MSTLPFRTSLKPNARSNTSRQFPSGSKSLLRQMFRYGLLEEGQKPQNKLDYVLAPTVENFLERRLQTQVFKSGIAKSIHHARVLSRQRHIRVARQVVNIPSFMVRVDSAKHIDFLLTNPFSGSWLGRVKQKNLRAAAKKAGGSGGDEAKLDFFCIPPKRYKFFSSNFETHPKKSLGGSNLLSWTGLLIA